MRAIIIALTFSLSASAPAFAQYSGASLDAGALSMRYADTVNSNAIAITPSFWNESPFTSLNLTGTFSQFTGGGWSTQGTGDGSIFTPRAGLFLGELGVSAGGSSRNDGSRTGQILGSGRLHVAAANQGAWIGGGGGVTWDGSVWRNVKQAEVAGWSRFGPAMAFASATPVIVDDSIKYTDAQASLSFNLPQAELSFTGGFRSGSKLPTIGGTATSWGSANVVVWLASRFAIVGSGGTYPVDLTQGFPGGRFASISLRVGARRSPPPSSSSGLYDLGSGSAADNRAEISFAGSQSIADGDQEIRFRAGSAQRVEMMGDMTDWIAVPLENMGDGIWAVRVPVAPGIHELNVRIDGGPWIAPPGLPAKKDEFGGSVGLFVVH